MKYKISAEQYLEIKAAQKANRDKQIENRLKVLALRYEGKSLKGIAVATGFHHAHISNLIRKYFEEGLQAVSEKHYAENRRNMSIEEEAAFFEQYRQSGDEGHILDVAEIEAAYKKIIRMSGSGNCRPLVCNKVPITLLHGCQEVQLALYSADYRRQEDLQIQGNRR